MKKSNLIENILATAIGGIALLLSSLFLNLFLSSPPTRAEFDEFKATITQQNSHIEKTLVEIKNTQGKILDVLINKKEK